MRKIFSENKIDAVINFAGFKAVGESVEKPLMYYENNLFGMVTLLEVMKEFDVKKYCIQFFGYSFTELLTKSLS